MPVQELVLFLDQHFLLDRGPFSQVGVRLHPRSRFQERPLVSEGDYALLQPPKEVERILKIAPLTKEIKVKDLLIFARILLKPILETVLKQRYPTFKPNCLL